MIGSYPLNKNSIQARQSLIILPIVIMFSILWLRIAIILSVLIVTLLITLNMFIIAKITVKCHFQSKRIINKLLEMVSLARIIEIALDGWKSITKCHVKPKQGNRNLTMETEFNCCKKCDLIFDSLEELNKHNLTIHMRGFMINMDTGANIMFSRIDHGKFVCPTCFRICNSFEEIPLHLFCELKYENVKIPLNTSPQKQTPGEKVSSEKNQQYIEDKYEFILNEPEDHIQNYSNERMDWINGEINDFSRPVIDKYSENDVFDSCPTTVADCIGTSSALENNTMNVENPLLYLYSKKLLNNPEENEKCKENQNPIKRILNPNKPFACSICGKGYATKFYLNGHMRQRHNEEVPKRPYSARTIEEEQNILKSKNGTIKRKKDLHRTRRERDDKVELLHERIKQVLDEKLYCESQHNLQYSDEYAAPHTNASELQINSSIDSRSLDVAPSICKVNSRKNTET